jgi:hypothetical protein
MISIKDGKRILHDPSGLVIATCTLEVNSYKLGMTHRQQEKIPISMNISSLNLANLWHKRLGHNNKRRLHEVQSASKGIGRFDASGLSLRTCCLKGKQHQAKFPKVDATRTQKLLEIIHSDICGPLRTSTFSGCIYFLTFIDDKSRYTKVYLLTHKSKVFQKFQEYKIEVENQTGKKIKVLGCDNGGGSINLIFLICSVKPMESNVNSLLHTPHNKMELVKGKIKPF